MGLDAICSQQRKTSESLYLALHSTSQLCVRTPRGSSQCSDSFSPYPVTNTHFCQFGFYSSVLSLAFYEVHLGLLSCVLLTLSIQESPSLSPFFYFSPYLYPIYAYRNPVPHSTEVPCTLTRGGIMLRYHHLELMLCIACLTATFYQA